MPRYHRYKHKPGGYWRGGSRWGRYYTKKGCAPLLLVSLLLLLIPLILVMKRNL